MTLSQVSTRVGALVGAVATSAVLLFAAPQAHASTARYYTIELAQPVTAQKTIVRGVMFTCEGASCRAPIASSAPRNVCVSIAREFGEVSSFKAGDRVLDASDLATCNEKKKVNIAKD
jgi:hypothetical protein